MRKNNYDSILYSSIVILIISAVMLGITGYQLYFGNIINQKKTGLLSYSTVNKSERDSLQQIYNSTTQKIDANVQGGGIILENKNAQAMLGEMNKLRQEIAILLKEQQPGADLNIAKQKIEELQHKLEILQNLYTNVDSENKRLQRLIGQLIAADKTNSSSPINLSFKEPQTTGKTNTAVAAAMHLYAITIHNSTEEETNASDEAEKIVGSFFIKNFPANSGGDIHIVVLQPDGKVMINSAWDTGTFNTREGKKIYSRKLYFEDSGDEKPLNFSLTPDRFLKGDYMLQVWYNGVLIGKTTRKLT
ncbi:MAG: hypothetical protein ABIW38_03050 [Ferruginibacter sp.]